ncbi:X-domain of DnaJ-containing-domain-containing protein [Suillus spraguei]|nr:X-domain of DnaJ-containing-domain-containing protein [Suillus spraguei]
MAPVETEYYDLLDVPVDVNDTDLKKAYRKQAMKYHPDKNSSLDAEEKFKDIRYIYSQLRNQNLRAVYDKNGKTMVDKESTELDDAAGFFANVFGGERFRDYIGEISLMKEMTSVAQTVMTDEERAELEKEGSVLPQAAVSHEPHVPAPGHPGPSTAGPADFLRSASLFGKEGKEKDKKRNRLTPEQKKKLQDLDEERKRSMDERVKTLTAKLIERLRPFVDAKAPGDKEDPETKAFESRMRLEADDLKLESFGVEVCVTGVSATCNGTVYMMKATSFMKSKKFLGIAGFWSRMKEKGSVAKDAWGVIGSAFSVQSLMSEMDRLQKKGELDEDVLRALEEDVTGKIMLASWRGTRFEVVQVLREVVDNVLKDKEASDQVLFHRAKGLMIMGHIFKSTVPDESDEVRRELERMVAEAAEGKSKHHHLRGKARREGNTTPEMSPNGDEHPMKEHGDSGTRTSY